MAKFVEVDVRGLSCPEPVLLTMDAMEEHPGEMIRVLGDEAHTRKNIEKSWNMNTSVQTRISLSGYLRGGDLLFYQSFVVHRPCRLQ